MDMFKDVADFHKKFEVDYVGPPRQLPDDLGDFRAKFLQEELDEYQEARREGNLGKQLDSLVDIIYVALGNLHLHGFNFYEGWRRVHGANMTKERAGSAEASLASSGRGSIHDIIKPANFVPPNFDDLVDPALWHAQQEKLQRDHQARVERMVLDAENG